MKKTPPHFWLSACLCMRSRAYLGYNEMVCIIKSFVSAYLLIEAFCQIVHDIHYLGDKFVIKSQPFYN